MAGLSEKHRELKRRRAEIVGKMGKLVAKEDDETPLDEGDKNTFDELADALETIDQRLQRVAAAMQAAAEGAQDTDGDGDIDEDDTDKGARSQSFRVRTGTPAR